jgi:UDP-GlcNAc3NAcA epimerase
VPGDREALHPRGRQRLAPGALIIKLVTVVGARPQFIKAATLSRAIASAGRITQVLVHTGQHYDDAMSAVFFEELDIPAADYELGIAGGTHAEMTGRMLVGIEQVLVRETPDAVLVFGDTNSTLAAALAAAKLNIPIAHVEAGLRSFNRRMPEETNRIVTDRISTWLFCPTQAAVENLEREGLGDSARLVGDVMFDAARYYADRADERAGILERLSLSRGAYVLATCHRAESTDSKEALEAIVDALAQIACEHAVIFPVHPRTRKALAEANLTHRLGRVRTIEPASFLDMVALERHARVIVTDSGGVQKEAFFHGVPCVTLRDETEWVETVSLGRNHLAGRSAAGIRAAFAAALAQPIDRNLPKPYGDGDAATRIEAVLAGN